MKQHEKKAPSGELLIKTAEFDKIPMPILWADLEGVLTGENTAAKKILGGSIIGESVFSHFKAFLPPHLKEMSGEASFQLEAGFGGREYVFTLVKDVVLKSLFLYGSDITDVKKVQTVLTDSEQRLRAIFRGLQVGIVIIDRESFENRRRQSGC